MVKIDVITGFLGAGKTTLIKKLLDHSVVQKERLVLIENEFGEIGIDGEIMQQYGMDVYEIAHGCICCTLKNDFVTSLTEIIENIKPDRILIEPSGVFIIDDLFDIVTRRPFNLTCQLNSITTVIDSKNFLKQKPSLGYFFESQIVSASNLILSKTQFVDHTVCQQIEQALRELNPTAHLLILPWDQLSTGDLRGILSTEIREDIAKLLPATPDHEHFSTYGISTTKIFSQDTLETTLESFAKPEYGEILRAKGFLNANAGFWEINYVNGEYAYAITEITTTGRIAIIGRQLANERLDSLLSP